MFKIKNLNQQAKISGYNLIGVTRKIKIKGATRKIKIEGAPWKIKRNA